MRADQWLFVWMWIAIVWMMIPSEIVLAVVCVMRQCVRATALIMQLVVVASVIILVMMKTEPANKHNQATIDPVEMDASVRPIHIVNDPVVSQQPLEQVQASSPVQDQAPDQDSHSTRSPTTTTFKVWYGVWPVETVSGNGVRSSCLCLVRWVTSASLMVPKVTRVIPISDMIEVEMRGDKVLSPAGVARAFATLFCKAFKDIVYERRDQLPPQAMPDAGCWAAINLLVPPLATTPTQPQVLITPAPAAAPAPALASTATRTNVTRVTSTSSPTPRVVRRRTTVRARYMEYQQSAMYQARRADSLSRRESSTSPTR